MDVFPAFRRRDIAGRGQYTRLDNDTDSQYSNTSRASSYNRRRQHDSPMLCDRCWIKHERKRASKRCLDCKQNLCTVCAKRDEITRPWWLPAVLVQCWRFFFSKAYTPHSFVELYDDDTGERRGWIHSQEASHIQPIPRVTRNSLRSYKSTASSSGSRFAYENGSFKVEQGDTAQKTIKEQVPTDNFTRSRSFEGFKERRRLRERRSRSVDRIHGKHWENDGRRAEKYESNWDDENILSSLNKKLSKKIVKGKDVDIELNGEDVKLTVNDDDEKLHMNTKKRESSRPTCAVKKTKAKKNKKAVTPEPYTEQIFTDVPIWFKRKSTRTDTRSSFEENPEHKSKPVSQESVEKCQRRFNSSGDQMSALADDPNSHTIRHERQYKRSNGETRNDTKFMPRTNDNLIDIEHDTTSKDARNNGAKNYTVEEPPDQCSICLEDLPKSESRLLKCSHQIHTKCLRQYLLRSEMDFGIRCPVCNQMTSVRDYYAPTELWYQELPISTNV